MDQKTRGLKTTINSLYLAQHIIIITARVLQYQPKKVPIASTVILSPPRMDSQFHSPLHSVSTNLRKSSSYIKIIKPTIALGSIHPLIRSNASRIAGFVKVNNRTEPFTNSKKFTARARAPSSVPFDNHQLLKVGPRRGNLVWIRPGKMCLGLR